MPPEDDNLSSLERARERLYQSGALESERATLQSESRGTLPHQWGGDSLATIMAKLPSGPEHAHKRLRFAGVFFAGALAFFMVSLAVAWYVFSVGGNSVSIDKVSVSLTGPTSIASGDVVPLTLTVLNTNAVTISDATVEISFPSTTRSADDPLKTYIRYSENLGSLKSGESVTRSVKAVLFGGAGETLSIPASITYGASGTNATFGKKAIYDVTISTTPLSLSASSVSEAVAGQPITVSLTVRSNTSVPVDNVVVGATLPFGFSLKSSSQPLTNGTISLGKLAPGATRSILLTGTLAGQEKDQKVFRFTVGTAKSTGDQSLALSYMSQDVSVLLAAPFISTMLTLNGDSAETPVLSAGSIQTAMARYTNTLPTNVTNATVVVTLSGNGIDYNSITASNGFYRSTDHAIVFSKDTDPTLAVLTPGASGIGSFTFSTLAGRSLGASPTVTLSTTVSGTRVGQSNVPETISASSVKNAKVSAAVEFDARTYHVLGGLSNSGPIPPKVGQPTTYTIVWSVVARGSTSAGSTVTTTLPSYVSYTGLTNGSGSLSFDGTSRTVSWNAGDLAPGTTATGAFQVSLVPSSSQRGSAPPLTGRATFSGYDRFAGIQLTGSVDPLTTETPGDAGYTPLKATVQ